MPDPGGLLRQDLALLATTMTVPAPHTMPTAETTVITVAPGCRHPGRAVEEAHRKSGFSQERHSALTLFTRHRRRQRGFANQERSDQEITTSARPRDCSSGRDEMTP